jgi:foldase protein PrsA
MKDGRTSQNGRYHQPRSMSNRVRRFLALGAFFVAVAAVAGCGSQVPGDAVVNVDGNPITTQAFNHWMYVAAKSQSAQSPGAPVIVPNDPPNFTNCVAQVRKQIPTLKKTPDKTIKADCAQLFTSLSNQVLGVLIPAYWYQAEAARDHITVTDKQVQAAFQKAKSSQFPNDAQFKAFLAQTGYTQADLLFRFRISQIVQKLLAKQAGKITPAQIAAYYHSHLSQFGTPETRDIKIVLTKTKSQADAALAALHKGQSWKVVAKKYSIDPTSKNNGGQLVAVQKGQEDHALDSAAFSASVNKVLGPVKGQFGYYVFDVTKITKPTQKTLAQSTATIQQSLKQQQAASGQAALNKVTRKHWLSQTFCRAGFAMVDCSNYHPPKSTTTTPGAPTTTTPTPAPSTPSTTPTTTTKK